MEKKISKRKSIIALGLVLIVVLTLFAGCGGNSAASSSTSGSSTAASSTAETPETGTVVIGSKNFSENLLVAEIYSLALEDAGFTVERKFALNTDVLHTALINGEIDLYPEYTGTAYLNILKLEPSFDKNEVYDAVKAAYADQFSLAVLAASDVNDTACYILTKERAEELGINSFADLQKKADQVVRATFLSSGEGSREEWNEYEKLYGVFNFKDVKSIDPSLSYTALDNGEVDLASALTTAPELFSGKYHILAEDQPTYIPYYLVPIVRQDTLDKYPDIATILDSISVKLNNDLIIALVTKTDVDKEEYEDVAKAYYEENIK
ncbi:MAG: glycine/betaine ABC transporter substrate-binding protein [Clostridiales Family XIII bacterium]|jgi:osmoprotectant transport system substrate-binding protein|nr:glycine/betaine ABC transporter substrate-binding protein [Clostridiales Family XIII bacterium]